MQNENDDLATSYRQNPKLDKLVKELLQTEAQVMKKSLSQAKSEGFWTGLLIGVVLGISSMLFLSIMLWM